MRTATQIASSDSNAFEVLGITKDSKEAWRDANRLPNKNKPPEENRQALIEQVKLLEEGKDAWKNTILQTVENEIPVLSMQAAWSYFVAMKTKKSTANIIQAQRDYFGAHGFNRKDQENSELLHGPWNKDKL